MDVWQAAFLGVVQGITEFLPISSSGHLVLVPALLGWEDQGLSFDVMLHLGSLLALLVYFRQDLWRLLKSLWTPAAKEDRRLVWTLVLATVPVAVLGVLLEGPVESVFRDPRWVAAFLAGLGVLYLTVGRRTSGRDELPGRRPGLIIGLVQALAILPGVSRSGSTTLAGVLQGYNPSTAARFSFLLGIPAIAGASLVALKDVMGHTPEVGWGVLLVGAGAAALSSLLAIHGLLMLFRRRGLSVFGPYLLVLATVVWWVVR